jgi:hypothetical protein
MDHDDFQARGTLASPHSPPHRFLAARAKPTAPRASTRATALIGVLTFNGEPPEAAHAAA